MVLTCTSKSWVWTNFIKYEQMKEEINQNHILENCKWIKEGGGEKYVS